MTADVSASLVTPEADKLTLPSYERPSGVHPPLDFAGYRSTALRHPKRPLVLLPHRLTEVTGPLLGDDLITPTDADLTTQHVGEPQGQRIIVAGRVLDSDGRPVPDTLIEIWQTNAAGRYRHSREHHPAPLDPNFDGIGRAITDSAGRYRFVTIQPGADPWGNHYNAWRPAHIHFSLFGRAFTQRLVTQMYFPGDPLLPLDPIFNSVPDERARQRLIAGFDIDLTQPEWALGYTWDIVLRGRDRAEITHRAERRVLGITPSQTVGPYFAMRLPWPDGPYVVPEDTPGAITIVGRMYDGAGNVIPDGLVETWQAGPGGRFTHPDDPRGPAQDSGQSFRGFGRCPTAPDGSYRIVMLKPGPLPTPDGSIEAPHLDVSVFARGLLDRVVTRMYFPDEMAANAADPVLCSIGEQARRATLIAVPEPDGELRFDIWLQGERETVFFDL
jgi:protocatechuate 3,4-dioxygenase, beta subunit